MVLNKKYNNVLLVVLKKLNKISNSGDFSVNKKTF
jgi:hypothetical protein